MQKHAPNTHPHIKLNKVSLLLGHKELKGLWYSCKWFAYVSVSCSFERKGLYLSYILTVSCWQLSIIFIKNRIIFAPVIIKVKINVSWYRSRHVFSYLHSLPICWCWLVYVWRVCMTSLKYRAAMISKLKFIDVIGWCSYRQCIEIYCKLRVVL